MSKHLIGLTLIDAPYSALNNAGTEASQATENIVTVKKLQKGTRYLSVCFRASVA